MQKVIITLVMSLVMGLGSPCVAGEVIKLTTHGKVISMPERNAGQGWDTTTGSILVEIQDQVYAIEDTTMQLLQTLAINDIVSVCFGLNEDDRISRLYIIEKI